MGRHKKVMCKVCYKEMRSDVKTRHMEQHSKREESNFTTNTYKTNKNNTTSDDSTKNHSQNINDLNSKKGSTLHHEW